MSKTHSRHASQSNPGTGLTDALKSCTLGTDANGDDHVWHRGGNAVVVHTERELEHYQYLGASTVGDWMQHVADARGWDSTGPFAALARKADKARKTRRQEHE